LLIKISPDYERIKSISKMIDHTKLFIQSINKDKFVSIIVREYHELLREQISIILLLKGYKTFGEGAHFEQISFLKEHFTQIKNLHLKEEVCW